VARQGEQQKAPTGAHDARIDELLFWPYAGAKLVLDSWLDNPLLHNPWLSSMPWLGLLDDHREPPTEREAALSWTTPHTIALELTTLRLRDFSTQPKAQPVLVCAPYALHGAVLTDFARDHSLVQALQQGGVGRLFVTDWRSAVPEMRYLSIDSFLADLNAAIDTIGSPVDLIGLCQGGWLSLLLAARFPEKVRRLVLVGTPVDVSHRSPLSRMVASLPPTAFEALVDPVTGLVSGRHLQPAWSSSLTQSAEEALQRGLADGADRADELRQRFARWDEAPLNLPGIYYVEVADRIFRENRIANGHFVALGRKIDLSQMALPLFLLAGTEDQVVPAEQALATAKLLGTPADRVQVAVEPSSHLGLMMGRTTLAGSWRKIADWLASDLDYSEQSSAAAAE
jgi:poly(3-hydroxyalkanoate) synthetase